MSAPVITPRFTLLSPIRVLDPVNELEEVSVKNPIIMGNPTSIQISKANIGLGITIIGGNDTERVSQLLDSRFIYCNTNGDFYVHLALFF